MKQPDLFKEPKTGRVRRASIFDESNLNAARIIVANPKKYPGLPQIIAVRTMNRIGTEEDKAVVRERSEVWTEDYS